MGGSPCANLKNDSAGPLLRRKSQYLTEIMIERYERPFLPGADREQDFILGPLQLLIANGHHIVAGCLEKLQSTLADIFVELELHAARVVGTGMIFSRAASAP